MTVNSKPAIAPRSFERWPDLPRDAQALVVASLLPVHSAHATVASKNLDQLVRDDPRWSQLLLGSGGFGPLPKKPLRVIDTMMATYGQGEHSENILRRVCERGVPLDDDSIFRADLECWVEREAQAGNLQAEEAARRIQQAHESKAPHLDLSKLTICTLPSCISQLKQLDEINLSDCVSLKELPDAIGQLTQLWGLFLSRCTSLEELPDAIGQLTQLNFLYLDRCARLERLPDTLAQLGQIQSIHLEWCTGLREKPLPAGIYVYERGLRIWEDGI